MSLLNDVKKQMAKSDFLSYCMHNECSVRTYYAIQRYNITESTKQVYIQGGIGKRTTLEIEALQYAYNHQA